MSARDKNERKNEQHGRSLILVWYVGTVFPLGCLKAPAFKTLNHKILKGERLKRYSRTTLNFFPYKASSIFVARMKIRSTSSTQPRWGWKQFFLGLSPQVTKKHGRAFSVAAKWVSMCQESNWVFVWDEIVSVWWLDTSSNSDCYYHRKMR